MEDFKADYLNLHIDLVNTITNLQIAERHLRIAEAYISEHSEKDNQIELEAVARASLTTGIHLVLPMLASLLNIAEASRVPCERRYPQLSCGPSRMQQ